MSSCAVWFKWPFCLIADLYSKITTSCHPSNKYMIFSYATFAQKQIILCQKHRANNVQSLSVYILSYWLTCQLTTTHHSEIQNYFIFVSFLLYLEGQQEYTLLKSYAAAKKKKKKMKFEKGYSVKATIQVQHFLTDLFTQVLYSYTYLRYLYITQVFPSFATSGYITPLHLSDSVTYYTSQIQIFMPFLSSEKHVSPGVLLLYVCDKLKDVLRKFSSFFH